MKIKVVFLSILVLVCFAFSGSERVQKKAKKEIKKFYDVEEFSTQEITIPEETNAETPSDFKVHSFFKVLTNDTFLGYAYIGNAPSKTATFDYLVLFDKDFVITKSKVLIYREEYGGEIGSKRWLRQFIGKTKDDTMQHGNDIIAISGATISTMSMTNAMNQLLESIKILHQKEVL